jgi:hypothetical protein
MNKHHTFPRAHFSLKVSLVKIVNYGAPHYVNPPLVPEISLDMLGQVNISNVYQEIIILTEKCCSQSVIRFLLKPAGEGWECDPGGREASFIRQVTCRPSGPADMSRF